MINTISKNAAIITGCLIFLGYCRYHFYYVEFGIAIYSYIETTELLLSFLPIIVQYLIPIFIIIYLAFLQTKNEDKNYVEAKTPLVLTEYIFNKRVKFKTKGKLILQLITHPTVLMSMWLLWTTIDFWTMVYNNDNSPHIEGTFYLLSFIWLVFVIEPFLSNSILKKYKGDNYTEFFRNIKFINYILILTLFIYLSQKVNASKVLKNQENIPVKIIMNSGEVFTTSKELVFVGKTTNYIFFRNLIDSTNIIINNSDVCKFTEKRIIKKKKQPSPLF